MTRSAVTTPASAPSCGVSRLAGAIGAEIDGLYLGAPPDDGTIDALRRAVLTHKVVFLRDQHLTYECQAALAARLGEVMPGHPIFPPPRPDRPCLRELDSKQGTRANHWHTDLTFLEKPPAFALLQAVVVPAVGGDTVWANTAAAYERLTPELSEVADCLRVVHSNDSDYTDATVNGRADYIATIREAEHPAVHVHPETGERALLLGGFARRVVGYPPQASRDLLRLFHDHVTSLEFTVRWRWRAGDLAIWDNRATQHYAIFDYGSEHRRGERVTVAGSAPIGVDGQAGVALGTR